MPRADGGTLKTLPGRSPSADTTHILGAGSEDSSQCKPAIRVPSAEILSGWLPAAPRNNSCGSEPSMLARIATLPSRVSRTNTIHLPSGEHAMTDDLTFAITLRALSPSE